MPIFWVEMILHLSDGPTTWLHFYERTFFVRVDSKESQQLLLKRAIFLCESYEDFG